MSFKINQFNRQSLCRGHILSPLMLLQSPLHVIGAADVELIVLCTAEDVDVPEFHKCLIVPLEWTQYQPRTTPLVPLASLGYGVGYGTLTSRLLLKGGAATNRRLHGLRSKPHVAKRHAADWFVAGEEGFEPPNDGFRARCLTAWRLPNGNKRSCL